MQQLALLSNISCSAGGSLNLMFRFLVPGSNGQLIFDSGFKKYSDDIIQTFLIHQTATSNYMDAEFLKSLGDRAIQLSSANVKVINAEKPWYSANRQGWQDKAFVTEANKLFFTGDSI